MKEKLSQIYNGIIGTFSNDTTGWSSKKITGFAITCVYISCHRYVSDKNLEMVLTIDAGLITALFAVNVVDKYKNPMEQHSPQDEPKV